MKILLTFFFILILNKSYNQTVRSIEINSYKYLVIDEINGKHSGETRRFFVKNLKSSGYNIINLKEPLKTHDKLPKDLTENPDLALYLVADEENSLCYSVVTKLSNHQGKILLSREGSSCSLLSTAIKKSISGLTSYNYKYEPTLKRSNTEKEQIVKNDWIGNGSGIIITKDGHIVTNHHVIQNANEIVIESIKDGVVRNFKCEVIKSDATSDLSILKIIDREFIGINDIPFNFKNNISDVGTKVYSFGYPMALSIMGKEMKVTDGIISSKSGFNGNITTYQITAPIQPGNSGGPLFDDNGNLIGITSSGINKSFTDNVGYAIKSIYIQNLIDVLPQKIILPNNSGLQSLSLVEQIKKITPYVVMVKVR